MKNCCDKDGNCKKQDEDYCKHWRVNNYSYQHCYYYDPKTGKCVREAE